ncbi:hypothetical protein IEO70_04185 [Bacillus sp. AGMB 02131]|uniref:DUF2178 domain-containing protein n=1 Tax=Peribacillus faecalis TaxID=2772559 RepID=A0A927HAK8_9BACI|nr:hypothetical protein [Peribacillus faecalis]MBD3107556.1 hypothetical protein [Peribacillus faecalis]
MKTILYRIAWIIFGGIIGSIIVFLVKGTFPIEVLAGFFTGGLILFVAVVILKMKRRDNIPSSDERIINNIKQFLLYAQMLAFAGLAVFVFLMDVIGQGAIPTLYMYIYLLMVVVIIGIGGYITKKM